MRTVHCPLCGLRFAHASELDGHARDEHAPPPERRQESLLVQRGRGEQPRDRHREVVHLPW